MRTHLYKKKKKKEIPELEAKEKIQSLYRPKTGIGFGNRITFHF